MNRKNTFLVILFVIFMVVSTFETTKSVSTRFHLNSFGLAFRPYVFTADFFFVNAKVFYEIETEGLKELSNELIYGEYRPISIKRDTYFCSTRIDRLSEQFCRVVANRICQRLRDQLSIKNGFSIIFKVSYPERPVTRKYGCD
jgi:hypothetical protein